MVTLTGIGTVMLQASQPAATNYTSGSARISFNVAPESVPLTFASVPDQTYGAAPITVRASSISPGPLTYSVLSGPARVAGVSGQGEAIALTGAGPVVLQVTQQPSGNYAGATAQTSFTILPEAPSLTFRPIATQTTSAQPVSLGVNTPSKGAVSFRVVSGPATVTGTVAHVTGVGTVVLEASQAAWSSFTAATVQTSFSVKP